MCSTNFLVSFTNYSKSNAKVKMLFSTQILLNHHPDYHSPNQILVSSFTKIFKYFKEYLTPEFL